MFGPSLWQVKFAFETFCPSDFVKFWIYFILQTISCEARLSEPASEGGFLDALDILCEGAGFI